MKTMLFPIAALIACTASAPVQEAVTRADRELAKELKDRLPGAPVRCINSSSVNGPQVIDTDTILYRETGRTIWRNELPSQCRALGPGNTIIIELHGGQICENDQFRVLEPGANIPGPYCRLGKFTPYRKAQ